MVMIWSDLLLEERVVFLLSMSLSPWNKKKKKTLKSTFNWMIRLVLLSSSYWKLVFISFSKIHLTSSSLDPSILFIDIIGSIMYLSGKKMLRVTAHSCRGFGIFGTLKLSFKVNFLFFSISKQCFSYIYISISCSFTFVLRNFVL